MKRRLLIAALAAIVIIVALAAFIFRSSDADAVAAASTWARMAPLPAGVRNLDVEVKGSMFTCEFIIQFSAPPDEVRQWLQDSAGTSSAKQSVAVAITIYSIIPGGGAQFAEVRVNPATGEVTIHTYWS